MLTTFPFQFVRPDNFMRPCFIIKNDWSHLRKMTTFKKQLRMQNRTINHLSGWYVNIISENRFSQVGNHIEKSRKSLPQSTGNNSHDLSTWQIRLLMSTKELVLFKLAIGIIISVLFKYNSYNSRCYCALFFIWTNLQLTFGLLRHFRCPISS